MATKKKRQTPKGQSLSKSRPRSYGEMYKNETTIQQPMVTSTSKASSATTKAGSAATVTEAQDWRVEYSHVMRDLRTLLVVSAVLFAVILVSGFFV